MPEKKVVLKKGKLPMEKDCHFGKSYEIVQSAESAVSEGKHVVITVLDKDGRIFDHRELTAEEKGNAFGVLIEFLQKEQPDGKWTMRLNGPGVTGKENLLSSRYNI